MPQYPGASTIAKTPAGAQAQAGADKQGNLLFAEGHQNKYAGGYGARIFTGASQVGVATSVGLATTYTGLCLSNPAGSGKNLALMNVAIDLIVAPAAFTAYGLIVGYAAAGIVTHTTALTPQCTFLNSAVGVGLVDAACTLVGTPIWHRWLTSTLSATGGSNFFNDIVGSLIIPPGGYVAIGSTIAGPTAGLLASFEWEENAQ